MTEIEFISDVKVMKTIGLATFEQDNYTTYIIIFYNSLAAT